jgi:hypothetical protein
MRRYALCAVSVLVACTAPAAWADDKTDCTAGIELIKAEIAKTPPKRVLDRLQKALQQADKEVDEGDWDECVAAVRTGKEAPAKK